jgi:hypothetical protein
MNPRPRPAFALALATAMVGATPIPLAADEPDEPFEHCYTEALTLEEAQQGAVSVVECYPLSEEAPAARGLIDLATVYTGTGGTGSSLTVRSTTCTGVTQNFGAGHAWDNVISSTQLLACGNAKHYVNTGASGAHQLVSGGSMTNMNATLDNQTSSIEYAP